MRHFYLRDESKFPAVCIASSWADGASGELYPGKRRSANDLLAFALSATHPKDRSKYSKQRAIFIASQRLEDNLHRDVIIVPEGQNVKRLLLKHIDVCDGAYHAHIRQLARLYLDGPPALVKSHFTFVHEPGFSLELLLINLQAKHPVFDFAKYEEPNAN